MRAVVLAICLAGCTFSGSQRPIAPAQPTEDMMPSAVLDRQDPGADTSRNPERTRSRSRSPLNGLLGGLFSRRDPMPAFGGPTAPPHYSQGCRGCSTERPGGLLVFVAVVGLGLRRRRPFR